MTSFIIPSNYCFNKLAQKSILAIPEAHHGHCLTPGSPRCWTSPRWSWSSINYVKSLMSLSSTTIVSTSKPRNQSLVTQGLPMVTALLLEVWGSGPHPDGPRLFLTMVLSCGGQDGSNSTPCEAVVRPVSKITHCHHQLQYTDSNKPRPKPANGVW